MDDRCGLDCGVSKCHTKEFGDDSVGRVLGRRMAHAQELCVNSQQQKEGLKEETVGRKISEEVTAILLPRSDMSLPRLTAGR